MAHMNAAGPRKTKEPARRAARKDRTKGNKAGAEVKPRTRNKRKDKSAPGARHKETKTQICIDLLSRPDGASIKELQEAIGWQAHSVRGFLAGAVKRKLGLTLVSEKPDDGPRRYRITSAEA